MPAGWVQAGVAVIGAGESIAANQAAGKAAEKNAAYNESNQQAGETLNTKAMDVANQPFVAYDKPMTAPLSGNQRSAIDTAKSFANSDIPQADNASATGILNSIENNPWSADQANKWTNPYTEQVINPALAQSNKSYLENLSKLNANGAPGSFGNGRNAVMASNLTAAHNLDDASLTANLSSTAYDKALSGVPNDQKTKLATAAAYEAAGQDITKMTGEQIQSLLATGNVEQVTNQAGMSAQYNEFIRQQGWSANQLNPLISAVKGGSANTNVQAKPASNVANQLLGLGSTLAGLWGGGASGGSGFDPNGTGSYGSVDQSSLDTQASQSLDSASNFALAQSLPIG